MQPLAERLRPKTLDEYIGQKHLVGPGAILRKMIDAGRISSFILWGPPGVGKTTLAQIIANKLETPFYTLSAVTSGVKDVREVIDRAKSNRFFSQSSPILFIDEIHRFSKSQQDSLLGAVENGTVTLIGATTENPSFEVIRPLLSRCQLYVLKSLEKEDLLELHVTGDGFLYNMVRILAGTLVDVGRGRICPEQMTEILDAKDRQAAGHTAPPFGLYLAKVYYEEGELYG